MATSSFGAASASSSRLASSTAKAKKRAVMYTDGACKGNKNVKKTKPPAGWGVVLLEGPMKGEEPMTLLDEWYGPVVLDRKSPHFIGAELASNNTAELSAIAQAMRGLLNRGTEGFAEVVIRFDSMYASNSVQGRYKSKKNVALINNCQKTLAQLSEKIPVRFEHVKGHSNDKYNDRADLLAGKGAAQSSNMPVAAAPSSSAPAPVPNKEPPMADKPAKSANKPAEAKTMIYYGRNSDSWSFVVLKQDSKDGKPKKIAEISGAIELDATKKSFLGAEAADRRTAALSAVGNAVKWVKKHGKLSQEEHVAIRGNSVFAATALQDESQKAAQDNLLRRCKHLYGDLTGKVARVTFEIVPPSDPNKQRCDELASKASRDRGPPQTIMYYASTSDSWSFVVLKQKCKDAEPKKVAEMWGPVELDARKKTFLGAEAADRRTAALSALGNAVKWVTKHGKLSQEEHVAIRGNSVSAATALQDESQMIAQDNLLQRCKHLYGDLTGKVAAVAFEIVPSSDPHKQRGDALASQASQKRGAPASPSAANPPSPKRSK